VEILSSEHIRHFQSISSKLRGFIEVKIKQATEMLKHLEISSVAFLSHTTFSQTQTGTTVPSNVKFIVR
jgi:hypothetical protein